MMFSLFHKSMSSLSDNELMVRISQKGDDRAFDELYHRHCRRLMGFLLRQLKGDEERAADLTQDTFMRLWANRDKYKPNNDALTWLFSIAYNLVKNEYRHTDYAKGYKQHILQTQTEEQDDDQDIQLDNKAFDEALRKELAQMDPPSRMLFSLRFEEEMTVKQIAQVMNIPEGTVKSRQHALVQTLKQRLKTYEI